MDYLDTQSILDEVYEFKSDTDSNFPTAILLFVDMQKFNLQLSAFVAHLL